MLCHVLALHVLLLCIRKYVKLKNQTIMATINLSNDFMAKVKTVRCQRQAS